MCNDLKFLKTEKGFSKIPFKGPRKPGAPLLSKTNFLTVISPEGEGEGGAFKPPKVRPHRVD